MLNAGKLIPPLISNNAHHSFIVLTIGVQFQREKFNIISLLHKVENTSVLARNRTLLAQSTLASSLSNSHIIRTVYTSARCRGERERECITKTI